MTEVNASDCDTAANKVDVSTTRMTTFIKTKFKKLDDQTNINKYRVAANLTEYHILSISSLESLFQNS